MRTIPASTMAGPGRPGIRGGGRRRPPRRLWALASVAVAALAVACAPPPDPVTPPPGPVAGIGQRTVSFEFSGPGSYSHSAAVEGGSVYAVYNGDRIVELSGTIEFDGLAGATASATFDLVGGPSRYDGAVSITDPSVGLDVSVVHDETLVAFDDDADGSATVTDGATQLIWSFDTFDATGVEPALDSLAAAEADFCRDAQRDLLGLSEAELPSGDIDVTLHQNRSDFVLSKPSSSPLETHVWAEPDMATTAAGNTVTLSHRLSCKTKSADAMALVGYPTTTDASCEVLAQGSLDLARSAMTQAERDLFDSQGRQVAIQPDRMAVAGPDWLAPFADEVVVDDTIEVTPGALLVEFNDPAYQGLPESFRGTHYCTVWSPAWSYWWMTEGAFAT